jgi:hypothetical protein
MKIQTAFRIEKDLLERLKVRAAAENRSLNNYVETVLAEEIGHEPNEETKQAIYEARNNINMTKIKNLAAYKKSLLEDV